MKTKDSQKNDPVQYKCFVLAANAKPIMHGKHHWSGRDASQRLQVYQDQHEYP